TGSVNQELPWVLLRYVVFHGLVAVICCAWAVRRLRGQRQKPDAMVPRKPRQQTGGLALPSSAAALRHHVILRPQFYREDAAPQRRPRPRPSSQPLLWKELYVDSVLSLHRTARALATVMVVFILMASSMVFLAGAVSWLVSGHTEEFATPFVRIF